ncbi:MULTISPECIES: hybrid sensor histidine kinase/response regulator [Olivibacter]|jgi:signal transduction histidine kinase|uniref:histidine kinase n=1 Tax=Olivibacter oleidegradans TaxID=760123 RepID=A0ABV6HGV6_9SPHI|nr:MULTISPECIES: hybrid sensor histidine kinase/response regulator [Olivibacter]MDM8176767.1 hybrid sensor histidine kinase/response regulator [Olivibacter sp. 47]QEL00582.1 response regulator [Olivibacter sp. LS-1]
MNEEIKILYLDDEVNNLVAFKAYFRLDYQIFVAENTNEALKILEEHPDLRIIFTDQRMPDKLGTDFLDEIRVIYPLPVRILLTAYTDDLNTAIDAINKGNVYRYVKKPWSVEAISAVITDANRYYLTNSLLSVKNRELEQAYNELDKFAHSVSHDIRGPLAGIMAAAQLAQDISDLSEIGELLQIIVNSAEKLDRYILTIHDYYSVRRGEFNIMDIDLNTLADDLRVMYEAIANAKGIRFTITINNSDVFRSDEVSVKLVLNNLLSNAFKYQKKDYNYKYVHLEMGVERGVATFVVKDSGIGIPEKYLGEIFKLFFRATLLEAGSGLGLYNVKNILTKLGGQIIVNSVENVGTEFVVAIPTK